MKVEIFELPVKPLKGDFEAPSVTSLQLQNDGSLLCGMAFAKPCLLRLQPAASNTFSKVTNLAADGGFEDDALAVVGGLRASISGETTFSLLHEGFLPGFVKGLFGKKIEGRKGDALMAFLYEQGGSAVRHSVIEIQGAGHGGRIVGRRVKEPGVLWDTVHVGGFVYGLDSATVWREPYLNSEKRETMRSDLGRNLGFHRDEDGYFWLMRYTGQLLRLGLADIKAVPTTLKAPDNSGMFFSSASGVDGWIYISCVDSKTLVRVRRNPVSNQDEMQTVKTFENHITSVLAVDEQKVAKLFVATEGTNGAQLWSLNLIKPVDAEELPAVPLMEKVREFAEFRSLSSLTTRVRPVSADKLRQAEGVQNSESDIVAAAKEAAMNDAGGPIVIWAGEGRMGWGVEKSSAPTRLVRIELD